MLLRSKPSSGITLTFLLPKKRAKLKAAKMLLWLSAAKHRAISFFHHFIIELQTFFNRFLIQAL
jgi:hypothetical protein